MANDLAIPNENTRKFTSKTTIDGYIRELTDSLDITQIIPLAIIDLVHDYHYEKFEAIWSSEHKGLSMELSDDDTKVTLTVNGDHECCRGRDPIAKGMIVEWTANCYAHNGMCLGVVSSKCEDFNNCANHVLVDAYGIDDCQNRVYLGDSFRHYDIRRMDDWNDDYEWNKPRIPHEDASQDIKIICDYKTYEYATLTYYFDNEVVKPPNQN
eukprot:203355_1